MPTRVWLAHHLAPVLAGLCAATTAAMYPTRTWLLFPIALTGAARAQLPASARRPQARTPNGEVRAGVRIPATAAGSGAGGSASTLLRFGGNARNADAMACSSRKNTSDQALSVVSPSVRSGAGAER